MHTVCFFHEVVQKMTLSNDMTDVNIGMYDMKIQ